MIHIRIKLFLKLILIKEVNRLSGLKLFSIRSVVSTVMLLKVVRPLVIIRDIMMAVQSPVYLPSQIMINLLRSGIMTAKELVSKTKFKMNFRTNIQGQIC